jgi:hypothetical protein
MYIDHGHRHLAIVSAFDSGICELIRALLEQRSAEYRIEIRELKGP